MPQRAARISVEVPQQVKAGLERIAAERNVPEEDLVGEALARFVDDEAEYQLALDEALEELKKGVFVSGDRVIEWMQSWGTDRELPTPEPDIFPVKPS